MGTVATIVTSVLNGAATLHRCMESVASQSYPCEHIIVDAGSTDGSLNIISEFNSSQVKLINAPRVGISEAFNIGIARSSGDIIGILNADDWYELDAVEITVKSMKNTSLIGFSYGSVILHDRDKQVLAHPVPSNRLATVSLRYMPFCHISSFVRRGVYLRYGTYDTRYRVAMDFDFYARVISQGVQSVCVEGTLGHITTGGLSSSLRSRFPEYLDISSRYLGRRQALRYLVAASARGWIVERINQFRLTRGALRRLGLKSRFVEIP